MEETLVFIDAGFLSRLSRYFGHGKYINFGIIELANNLAKNQSTIAKHFYYCTAPPYQGTYPTKEEKERKIRYDKFKSYYSKRREVTLLEGRVQRLREKDGRFVYKQKGVDTVLTMALSSFISDYPSIKKIILIACDSDFVPVIGMLINKGIDVILCSYYERKRDTEFSRSHHLIDACTKFVQLSAKDFEEAKFDKNEVKNG